MIIKRAKGKGVKRVKEERCMETSREELSFMEPSREDLSWKESSRAGVSW